MIHCMLFCFFLALVGHISLAPVRRTSINVNSKANKDSWARPLQRALGKKKQYCLFCPLCNNPPPKKKKLWARLNIFKLFKSNVFALWWQPLLPPWQILIIFSSCAIMSSCDICSINVVIFIQVSHPLSSRFWLRYRSKFPLNIKWPDLHLFKLHNYVHNSTAVIQQDYIEVKGKVCSST